MFKSFLVRMLSVLLLLPAVASAAPLDDYYLSKFGEQAQLARALRAVVGLESEPVERCRTHLYRSLKRDFSNLEPETRKTLGKYVTRPVLTGQASASSAPVFNSAHFAVHYTTTGLDAPSLTDANGNLIPDYVERVAAVFEEVYAYEVTTLGYRPPPVATRYDVYLRNLIPEQAYGFTSDDGVPASPAVSASSYIEIDKAFSDNLFTVNGRYTADQMLQITAAHEFHHAIQFGYNYYFDIWYGEVTATWMEDELYDSVNQLYSYLPRYIPLGSTISLNGPLGGNSEYGRWIFNRHLAERHSAVMVRAAWEKLATLHPSTSPATQGGDIQMSPVLDSVLTATYGSALADEFFGFAKRIYAKDWSSHLGDAGQIATQAAHALTASYSTYPVTSSSPATPAVTLPRYTFAFFRFVPNGTATLNIALAKTTGIQAAVFRKSGGVVSEIAAGAGGTSYSVPGFNTMNPVSDEVVLLVANTTNVDSHQANFSTDGIVQPVQEPGTVVTSGGGGGGGGCFIATAAYGSYLHPRVAALRGFRDNHLLTNAPGRLFVSLYYRLSPPVAEMIGEHEWLRAGVRTLLVPLILSVEYPAAALAALLLVGAAGSWRLRRRRCRV